jgi:HD-GYP domain-containing protein (c-di-GMP phosphodiesterase class II)
MNVLLFDNQPNEELNFTLESRFGSKVFFSSTLEQAINCIGSNPIDLIISKKEIKENIPIFQKVLLKKIIVCLNEDTDFRLPENVSKVIIKSDFYNNLSLEIERVLGKAKKNLDYCPIKTSLLLSVCPLKADIFVKIGEKFIKIYRKDDVFDLNDFKNITEKKKLEYLFIKKENIQEFIDSFVIKAKEKQEIPVDNIKQVVADYCSLYEAVQSFSESLGFTKEIQVLAKTQVKSVLMAMGKKPNLKNLLSRLDQFKGEYIGVHSVLTGYLASSICSQLDWGSEQTYYKLTLSAFLHDIAFTDNRLAMCQSIDEVVSLGYSKDKIELFKNHTILASNLAANFTEIPPDVDTIILQHHEIPDGSGFPKKLTHAYISTMSAIFFIAHRMAEEIVISDQSNFDLTSFITKMKTQYPYIKYRKMFEALEKLK